MTWEETIIYIRKKPEFKRLVELAYFEEDLVLNVERFRKGEEFKETLSWIKKYQPQAKRILDIGSGNGISSIAFALLGYDVTAVEPDSSDTVGAGAIRRLAEHYQLDNIRIFEDYAESIAFPSNSFDLVYVRQAMHHANDLKKFVKELGRVLKRGGCLLTVRDHVVFGRDDKELFLKAHPLHRFYGGENAFSPDEYKMAMNEAGLRVEKELRYYDSVINYFPLSKTQKENMVNEEAWKLERTLKSKIGLFAKLPLVLKLYFFRCGFNPRTYYDEMKVPGRMYSYIAIKD